MRKISFETFINGVRNDFNIALDDLFNIIEAMKEDIDKLKADKKPLE